MVRRTPTVVSGSWAPLHSSLLLPHSSAGKRLRHPHGPGTTLPLRGQRDHDLFPCPESRADCRPESLDTFWWRLGSTRRPALSSPFRFAPVDLPPRPVLCSSRSRRCEIRQAPALGPNAISHGIPPSYRDLPVSSWMHRITMSLLDGFFPGPEKPSTRRSLTETSHWHVEEADFFRVFPAFPAFAPAGSLLGLAEGAWPRVVTAFLDRA